MGYNILLNSTIGDEKGVYWNNDEVETTPYIQNINKIVEEVAKICEDNFYAEDKGTITRALQSLQDLDDAVRKTNILYKKYPEKEQLMKTILEETEEFKNKKTGLNPNMIGDACVDFNNDLYTAKIARLIDKMYNCCDDYNQNYKELIAAQYPKINKPESLYLDNYVVVKYADVDENNKILTKYQNPTDYIDWSCYDGKKPTYEIFDNSLNDLRHQNGYRLPYYQVRFNQDYRNLINIFYKVNAILTSRGYSTFENEQELTPPPH